ncbi:hypothetical protein ACOMHN_044759 [Nucella lapillus]
MFGNNTVFKPVHSCHPAPFDALTWAPSTRIDLPQYPGYCGHDNRSDKGRRVTWLRCCSLSHSPGAVVLCCVVGLLALRPFSRRGPQCAISL